VRRSHAARLAGRCERRHRTGTITQADLAGASPATHYYLSVPGNLPPVGTTDPAKQVGLFLVFHEHGSNPGVEMPSVIKSLANLRP
jgi:hypothetical protein